MPRWPREDEFSEETAQGRPVERKYRETGVARSRAVCARSSSNERKLSTMAPSVYGTAWTRQ